MKRELYERKGTTVITGGVKEFFYPNGTYSELEGKHTVSTKAFSETNTFLKKHPYGYLWKYRYLYVHPIKLIHFLWKRTHFFFVFLGVIISGLILMVTYLQWH